MMVYTLKQLSDIGVISQRLKRVLVLLGCSNSEDMIELSNDWIKVDYIEKSHKLKDELFKAVTDVKELDDILPEFVASANTSKESSKKPSDKKFNKRTFKVGDYTEHLLEQSSTPIKVDDLLRKIRYYLPRTYIESIRANLNGDPKGRFIFFLDGYVGLKRKEYDKRFQVYSVENKKIQYAEQRIMEFLSFMEEKHRSPQPHGLDAEESLYRWYLDFTKSTAKELADLRVAFQQYLKEYDQWMFTPFEYSYKRNCDQVKWYVDVNLELPTQEDEPELSAWFNSQLECYEKHKDKRKKMFVDLKAFLEDYGMHFYDAKSAKGKTIKKKIQNAAKRTKDSSLVKYSKIFKTMKGEKSDKIIVVQKALLLIAIGNLIQNKILMSNEITLSNDLLMEFADVCFDNIGSAYNIAIPFYYLNNDPFWSLLPKECIAEDKKVDEPTYDFIEHYYSGSIIDQELFDLLANKKEYAEFKRVLIEDVIDNKKKSEPHTEDVKTTQLYIDDAIETTIENEQDVSDNVINEEGLVDEDDIENAYINTPTVESYNVKLEVALDDRDKLETVFDNKSTSYKYFWFMAIISLAKENKSPSVSYREILIRMASMAWHIVIEYGIELGKQDMLKKYLNKIEKREGFDKRTSYKVVESRLKQYYFSQGYDKLLSPLLINVPYRFLSPWIAFTTKAEVIKKSISNEYNGLYSLVKDGVILKKGWWIYINSHYEKVCDFVNKSFLLYIKKYNNDIVLLPFITYGWSFFKKEQSHKKIEPYSTGDFYSTKAAESKNISGLLEIEHVYLDNVGNIIRTEIEREKMPEGQEGDASA